MNLIKKAKDLVFGKNEKLNVQCICCNQKFHSFLPFGLIERPNALCPGCSSLERHRLHYHYMLNKTNLFNSPIKLKLLHVAPERIFYNKFIVDDKIDYIPCAKFGEGYEDIYPKGTKSVDITRMEFGNNTFDAIYCSHVLEHIVDDQKAMLELYRVLKPGGWAMLEVPIDYNRYITYEDFSIINPIEREKAFGQRDHVRIYGLDYKDRLLKAGFTVKEDNYIENFSQRDISRYGFMRNEIIYFCTKS